MQGINRLNKSKNIVYICSIDQGQVMRLLDWGKNRNNRLQLKDTFHIYIMQIKKLENVIQYAIIDRHFVHTYNANKKGRNSGRELIISFKLLQ